MARFKILKEGEFVATIRDDEKGKFIPPALDNADYIEFLELTAQDPSLAEEVEL